jgi:hypothetical protein
MLLATASLASRYTPETQLDGKGRFTKTFRVSRRVEGAHRRRLRDK